MSPQLRWCAALLVVVNLVFVHVTGAADLAWLLPMYALAAASPWLARLHDRLLYRAVWNVAVLGIFALLVQHATSGLHQLLEDGLRLAAISQVHLVCNLGRRQRPDLLFFNSFLIAVVTAFLTQALAYSVVFLVYAPALILALEVHCVVGDGSDPGRALRLRSVARDALVRTGFVLALTAPAFLLLPRDFDRRGVFGDELTFAAAPAEVDFSEEVTLERHSRVTAGARPVLEAELLEGAADDVPLHWRGATLLTFDGRQWTRGTPRGLDATPWRRTGGSGLVRDLPHGGTRLAVQLEDRTGTRLFAPATARGIRFPARASANLVHPADDLTLEVARAARSGTHRIRRYELELAPAEPLPGAARTRPGAGDPALQVPHHALPPSLPALAKRLAAEVPEDAPDRARVEAAVEFLSSERLYLAPGEEGAARTLDEFVRGARPAHCEYFASTLALLLRLQGVPARVVTGYLSDEWNGTRERLTIRTRHAHAWVEVRDPELGWYTVDPTPVAVPGIQATAGLWNDVREGLESAWGALLHFDAEQRLGAFEQLLDLPVRAFTAAARHPWRSGLGLVSLAALLAWLVFGRRPRRDPSVSSYERAVRATGVPRRAAETPREYLARAALEDVPPERLDALRDATERHEQARYART